MNKIHEQTELSRTKEGKDNDNIMKAKQVNFFLSIYSSSFVTVFVCVCVCEIFIICSNQHIPSPVSWAISIFRTLSIKINFSLLGWMTIIVMLNKTRTNMGCHRIESVIKLTGLILCYNKKSMLEKPVERLHSLLYNHCLKLDTSNMKRRFISQ